MSSKCIQLKGVNIKHRQILASKSTRTNQYHMWCLVLIHGSVIFGAFERFISCRRLDGACWH